jgi:hypothetical protein
LTTPSDHDLNLTRRGALRLTAGAGAMALLTGLGACGSTKKTAGIGAPIPADPAIFHTASVRTVSPAVRPTTGLPSIITRSSWTSAKPKLWDTNPMGRISRITIHHDGMPTWIGSAKGDAADRLQRIRKVHVVDNGWADIGYHYAIDPGGRIWEARSTTLQGAHVKDNNEQNLGILVMGNFNNAIPTPAAERALVRLIEANQLRYKVPVSRVKTHQEINPTECPGRNLQQYMVQARGSRGVLSAVRV